jgi:serine/threonine-protein kinase
MELTQVGKYNIIDRIGQGAMGVVYKARDPVLNRDVAIKTISSSLGADEQFRKRFQREAQSAAQLNHKNIVTIYEFGQQGDLLYMVMELLGGRDLKDIIARRALPRLDDKLAVVEQILRGLAFAHGKGVIHRDLKPANIHVLSTGTVKILDFGLARLGVSEMTRTGTVMGTPNYMSPEQVRAEGVDARSDLFSVGAVFYELLAGRKPFDAESMHAILFEVLEHDPQPLRALVPEMPPLILPIVDRALVKDPAGRYQSAIEMLDAIRGARRALASAQAAAAVLTGTVDLEATLVGNEPPTVIAPASASQASFASLSRQPTMVAGATALDLDVGRNDRSLPPTARPDATLAGVTILEPAAWGTGKLLAILGTAALLIVVAAASWRAFAPPAPSGPVGDLARQQEGVLRAQLVASQIELARANLENKDWTGAALIAEKVLGLEPTNAAAREILARSRNTLASLDAAAKEAKADFAKGDTEAASRALSRVLAIDPRHPVAGELTAALNRYFSEQASQARAAAAKARLEAERGQAAASEPFRAADRLAREGQDLLGRGQFAEATQKFSLAGDGFDRARRSAETAAAVAAAAAASAAVRTASSSPATERVLPPSVAPTSTLPPATVQTPSLPPPPVAPSVSNPPTVPTMAPGAGHEQAVRRLISEYGRALESRDLALFKSLKPGLSSDEEKRLKESFKAIQSQRVALTVDSVQIDGVRAVVRVSRQDTINGRAMKPLQQTFRLAQKDGAWTIESIGQ